MFTNAFRNLKSVFAKHAVDNLDACSWAVSYPMNWWGNVYKSGELGTGKAQVCVVKAGRKGCICRAKSKGLRWTHFAGQSQKAYVECTALLFVVEYTEAVHRETELNVLKRIVVTLNADAFWFLEKQQVESYCQPMRMVSSIEIVRERTNRNLQRVNQASKVVLEPLDPAPDPFMEQTPFCPIIQPAGRHVCGEEEEFKGRPANAAYRKMVANVASVFENVGSAEKGEITMRLVEELQNKR